MAMIAIINAHLCPANRKGSSFKGDDMMRYDMKQNTGIQRITDQLNIARVEIGRLSVKNFKSTVTTSSLGLLTVLSRITVNISTSLEKVLSKQIRAAVMKHGHQLPILFWQYFLFRPRF